MSVDGSGRDPVERLAESFLERLRRGEAPLVSEYAARFPEHAAEILDLFPALVEIESAKRDAVLPNATLAPGAKIPERLGDYHIVRFLGAGGMGVVYEAERQSLRSHVALKVLHPRLRIDPTYLARFRNEARSAARLHHTNIVTVFDYGEQDGVFYYAMQYIPGQGLDRVLGEVRKLRRSRLPAGRPEPVAPLSSEPAAGRLTQALLSGRFASEDGGVEQAGPKNEPRSDPAPSSTVLGSGPSGSSERDRYYREVARVGLQVADALAHAHAQGVIHRDIKPANLILDARGNVWVTDFGLAKFEDQDLSRSQDIVGTLRFMSPERFRGVTSPAADIYALGATLYELLTFRPVFAEDDRLRLIHQIAHDRPTPPRAIDPTIPRDLEAIVLKALEKEPGDRFRTAEEFGKELDRFRNNLPTHTRPLSAVERLGRWCRRSPAQAALVLLAAVFTTIVALGSTGAALVLGTKNRTIGAQNAILRQTTGLLRQAERDARVGQFEAYVAQAKAQRFSGRPGQRFGTLQALREANRLLDDLGFPADLRDRHRLELRNLAIASLALPDVRRVGVWPDAVRRPSPDWRRFFHIAPDGSVRVTRADDGTEIARLQLPEAVRDVNPLLDPYVGVGTGAEPGPHGRGDHLRLYRFVNDRFVPVYEERGVASFLMCDEQTLVVSRLNGSLAVIDLERRRPPWVIPERGFLQWWTFSREARTVAVLVGYPNGRVRLLNVAAGTIRDLSLPGEVCRIDLTPDGRTLAVSFVGSGRISLIDLATERVVREYDIPSVTPSLCFNSTGMLLATRSFETLTARFLESATGRLRLTLPGSRFNFYDSFSKEGRMYAADSLTPGLHQLWQFEPAPAYRTFTRALAGPPLAGLQRAATLIRLYSCEPAIRADGRLLALEVERGQPKEREVVLWDLTSGRELGSLPSCQRPSFTAEGDLLTDVPRRLRWPVREHPGAPGRIDVGPPVPEPVSGRLSLWRSGHDLIDVSPDGSVRAEFRDGLVIRSLSTRTAIRTLVPPTGTGKIRLTARFSPDGHFLAAVAFDGQSGYRVRFWRVETWDEPLKFTEGESACAFAPDSRSLAVETNQGAIRLIDLSQDRFGRELARLEDPDHDRATSLAFAPDGAELVVASEDGHCLHVWDLRTVRRKLADWGLDWQAPPLPPAVASAPAPAPTLTANLNLGGTPEEFEPPALRESRLGRLLKSHPDNPDLQRRHLRALLALNRNEDVTSEATTALRARPTDPWLHAERALAEARQGQHDAVLDDLEAARRQEPNAGAEFAEELALVLNNAAWSVVSGANRGRVPASVLAWAREAASLVPDVPAYQNTLGVALYRAARYGEAAQVLERNLAAGGGSYDAIDLLFLAMTRHRLGDAAAARRALDRAATWLEHHPEFVTQHAAELSAFRTEAVSVLHGPVGELPACVFAPAPGR